MDEEKIPTIKGVFVNSHIEQLRNTHGDEMVEELKRGYGKPLEFLATQDVPIREEVEILETIVDLTKEPKPDAKERSLEAGRLHFRNFSNTSFAGILFSTVPKTPEGFKKLLLNSDYIVNNIFKNTEFESAAINDRKLKVTMGKSDYPMEHFQGLLQEWAAYFGLGESNVEASESDEKHYEYTITYST